MWLGPLSSCLLAATMLSQATPTPSPLPEPITTHRPVFAIPFEVKQGGDPSKAPAEVQLHISTDRGANWQFYARATPTQKHFMFKAGPDGEYWFAIRTIDRSGQSSPATVSEPGLRVVVDTKSASPAVATTSPRKVEPQVSVQDPPATQHSKKPVVDATLPDEQANGSVAIAINPAIGKNYGNRAAGESLSSLPPGERPRMVNSLAFELDYDVDSIGPSGIGRVELWSTRDGGRTWKILATDNDGRSPLRVNVPEEGVYGFRVAVANGAGLGAKPPKPGDLPDLWIGVDLTKPTARIVSAQQGIDAEAGDMIISWQADDRTLAARPVALSYGENRGGPWLPVASGLENTGRYAWPIDARTPGQFYLRLEVRDEAGNVGMNETAEPVAIDQSRPTIHVRKVRPIEQSARPARRS